MSKRRWIGVLILLGITLLAFPGFAAQEVRFAVFSDPHYYDNSLGVTGEAFEAYLAADRKMIAESEAILTAAINAVAASNVQFLIIPGDLTKDGELSSHQEMAAYLQGLEDQGIQVYVTPGNHDINNPDSFAYDGPNTTPVPNITPEEFAQIYGNFGYGQALERDPNSLSYLAEPTPGLCILAMDACRYRENVDYPIVDGKFSNETLDWILKRILWARTNHKQIIGFMHHGVVQHFKMQALLFGDYLLDDRQMVARLFAEAGMPIVFTGHFHAQDAVKRSWATNNQFDPFLFDVETGSLVSYPVPYRLATLNLDTRRIQIESHHITEINYDTNGLPFPEYALAFIEQDMMSLAQQYLVDLFGLDPDTAADIAPDVALAMIAHMSGDETPTPDIRLAIRNYLLNPDPLIKLVGAGLFSLWTDPIPADNNVTLDLITGAGL